MKRRAVLIAGPTASGKSAFAVAVARALGGAVVNADSMQVYRDLRIVTARPDSAAEQAAPHHLYGHVGAEEPYSAARWLADARGVVEGLWRGGQVPVIVGGTGLYFRALTAGLAPVPDISDDVRRAVRDLQAAHGAEGLAAALAREDPPMKARLRPGDTQRLARALEVIRATGRSLGDWQTAAEEGAVVAPEAAVRVVVSLPRADLYARINARFDQMIAAGGLEEVAALAARRLDPSRPAMKALGVPQLIAHLSGDLDRDAAIELAKRKSRQYAKRQVTWIRHQMADWGVVDGNFLTAVEKITQEMKNPA